MFNSSPRDPLGPCIPREAETPGNKTSKVCASRRTLCVGAPFSGLIPQRLCWRNSKEPANTRRGERLASKPPPGSQTQPGPLSFLRPDVLSLKEPERKWRMRKKRTLDPFSIVDGPMTDRLWPGQEKESWFSVYVETIIICYTEFYF